MSKRFRNIKSIKRFRGFASWRQLSPCAQDNTGLSLYDEAFRLTKSCVSQTNAARQIWQYNKCNDIVCKSAHFKNSHEIQMTHDMQGWFVCGGMILNKTRVLFIKNRISVVSCKPPDGKERLSQAGVTHCVEVGDRRWCGDVWEEGCWWRWWYFYVSKS